MEHLDGGHEGSDADLVVGGVADLLGFVVNGIELTNFVTDANCFEETLDGGSVAWHLEVSLRDTQFSNSCWEEQIDSLWLVTIVGIVSHRSDFLEWDISANSWAAKGSILVLNLAYVVRAVAFHRLSQVVVWCDVALSWLTVDALSSVPVSILFLLAKDLLWVSWMLTLTQVLYGSEHVLCNGFLILDNLLNDHGLGEGLLIALWLHRPLCSVEQPLLAIAKSVSLG